MSKSKINKKSVAASKKKKAPSTGNVVVNATYTNTIITVTTLNGDTVAWSSGGRTQKGARKATAFAAEEAAKQVAEQVLSMGMNSVHVILRGPGNGRDAAVKGLAIAGLHVLTLRDDTGVPFNGCRQPKEKRN